MVDSSSTAFAGRNPLSKDKDRLMARAVAVNAQLRGLFKKRHQNLAEIAHQLAVVKREELYRYLNYTSVFTFAWGEHRMGKSKVSELIGISEASESLPEFRDAFDTGQLHWTKAREIAKVVTP